jgi:hypothetical protein
MEHDKRDNFRVLVVKRLWDTPDLIKAFKEILK